ncbi:hypothetical protein GQ600_4303 [Phytophthora cactorum]|nr:hypothetical protein GQ600_4303 [Phytophthora cactorum]
MSKRMTVLRKNIRNEHDLFRCLLVDKCNDDTRVTGRVIHDLSFPEGGSVNSHSSTDNVPKPVHEHCSRVAQESTRYKHAYPNHEVQLMADDTHSARQRQRHRHVGGRVPLGRTSFSMELSLSFTATAATPRTRQVSSISAWLTAVQTSLSILAPAARQRALFAFCNDDCHKPGSREQGNVYAMECTAEGAGYSIRFASQCLRARLPKLNGWKPTPSTHRVSRAALFALLSTPSAMSHQLRESCDNGADKSYRAG